MSTGRAIVKNAQNDTEFLFKQAIHFLIIFVYNTGIKGSYS